MAVTRVLDRQFAKLALEGLLALTIAGVTGGIGDRLNTGVAKMLGHLGFHGTFN